VDLVNAIDGRNRQTSRNGPFVVHPAGESMSKTDQPMPCQGEARHHRRQDLSVLKWA